MNTNIRRLESISVGKLDEKANYIEKKDGVSVYRLNMGEPDIKTDESYYKAFAMYAKQAPKVNAYGDYKGNVDLRKSYAVYYNEKIKRNKFNKEDIQVTLGASDAIISTLKTVCNENDGVILIEPFFADYKMYCKLLGLDVKSYTIKEIMSNKAKIDDNCRVILFSNPGNPDGKVFNKDELDKITRLAKKNDLYIISDEVYSEIAYSKFISLADYDYNKSIIVDSASKKFSNGGARVGAIITKNTSVLDNIHKIYNARISISNVEQYAVNNMFKQKDKIFDNILKIYNKRKNNIENYLQKQDVIKYEVPDGGLFFLLELPVKDTEKFSEWVLENYRLDNQTVYIQSAKDFYCGNEGKNKVRLSFNNNSKYVIKGLDLLKDAVEEYNKNEGVPVFKSTESEITSKKTSVKTKSNIYGFDEGAESKITKRILDKKLAKNIATKKAVKTDLVKPVKESIRNSERKIEKRINSTTKVEPRISKLSKTAKLQARKKKNI